MGTRHFKLRQKTGRSFRGVTKGEIECNIWNAGGDPNSITFGVGMSKGNRIALNHLYDVVFDQDQTEQVAPDFSVKTKWLKK